MNFSVTFNSGVDGKVESITLHQNGQHQVAKRTEKVPKKPVTEIELPVETLESYIGKYEFAKNVYMEITREENRLFIQLTGQQKFQAYASAQNKFFLKVIEASITFNSNSNSKIESLTLHQGGRDQIAKRIE